MILDSKLLSILNALSQHRESSARGTGMEAWEKSEVKQGKKPLDFVFILQHADSYLKFWWI